MHWALSWPWLALALLGAYHGLNPGMGWLFAVARGLQEGSRAVVLASLVPIVIGHEASIVVAVGVAVAVGVRLAATLAVGVSVGVWGGRAGSFLPPVATKLTQSPSFLNTPN